MNKKIEKPKYVHLGLRILNLSKINMHYFWYNYTEENIMAKINPITLIQTYPSYKSKLNFICIYSERYRKGFNNSNYEVERPLGMSENNKLLGMMKDQFLLKGKLGTGEKDCTNTKMLHKNLPKFDDNKNCLKEKKYESSYRSFRKRQLSC